MYKESAFIFLYDNNLFFKLQDEESFFAGKLLTKFYNQFVWKLSKQFCNICGESQRTFFVPSSMPHHIETTKIIIERKRQILFMKKNKL